MIRKIILLIFLLALTKTQVPLLNDDIGQEIFHENKHYVIYTSNIPSPQVIAELEKFCQKDRLCAILNGQNQMYEQVIQFVGFNHPDYLLIFDVPNRLKYCRQVKEGLQESQIEEFYNKFQKGQLEPHYTSEPIPQQQTQEYLKKIVGFTFKQFLDQPNKVRVLYLYAESQLCDNCIKVYEEVVKNAKLFTGEPVDFGFLDLFKNQHALLKEEDIPLALVYSKNSRNYQKLNVDERSRLGQVIRRQLEGSIKEEQL